jgi:hypothetical protein
MPTPKLPDSLLIEALNLAEEYGSGYLAILAGATKLPQTTLNNRIAVARQKGLRPTFKKDAPRIYTRQRLGRTHLVIPDTQVKPGVNTDHLEWIGNFASEKRPDVIVMIGDWWDLPSLSSYDKGKLSFEGRRYVNDIKAGRDAMERLLKPIQSVKDYSPRMIFTTGNHEHRITRFADTFPEMSGKVDLSDMGIADYGWEVLPFLKPIEVDGVLYAHYFTSGSMGRPVSSAAALLRETQQSATMGHTQFYDVAVHKKTLNRALFSGCCYTHEEDYLTPQGHNHKRHIVMKHEVENGRYDLMEVSIRFLGKSYC